MSDYERTALGALLRHPSELAHLIADLNADDFTGAHPHIADALVAVAAAKRPIDVMTIGEHLKAASLLELVGGPMYLDDLMSEAPTTVGADFHLSRVSSIARQRRFTAACLRFASEGTKTHDDPDEWTQGAMAQIAALQVDGSKGGFVHIGETANALMARLTRQMKEGAPSSVLSGVEVFDQCMRLADGDSAYLAGTPGMGKTSISLQVARGYAEATRRPVAIFSLEMTDEELVLRMASASGLTSDTLRHRAPLPSELASLGHHLAQLSELPIHTYDVGGVTIEEVSARVLSLRARLGPLSLVIIDFVQIMGASKCVLGSSRANQIGHMTKGIKTLAKAVGCPFLTLSQLSKEHEKTGRKPRRADLRDSGTLGQDADSIMFLWAPALDDDEMPPPIRDGVAYTDKVRSGPNRSVDFRFIGKSTRFEVRHG